MHGPKNSSEGGHGRTLVSGQGREKSFVLFYRLILVLVLFFFLALAGILLSLLGWPILM